MGSEETTIRVGILTVSDRCYRKEAEDKSGEGLADFINREWKVGTVQERRCVPDEIPQIQGILHEWADGGHFDLILTTGGTGFAPRDVTPEATKPLLDKEAPGMVIAMIQGSLAKTPMAMLSRPACGVRKGCLIVNLPGSVKGSLENFQIIQAQLKHAADLLKDSKKDVESQHAKMSVQDLHMETKVNSINVADRARKSPFETIQVEKAQNIVIEQCSSLVSTERRTLRNGLGFVLAEDVYAQDPLPPFPASIKDGYAVKVSADMNLLNVRGDSTAGESPEKCHVKHGYCVRVSTGAPVPPGADAVIQIEDTELVQRSEDGNEEKVIRIFKAPTAGQDIRPIGSDIQAQAKVLNRGTKLGPAELGVLATIGVTSFTVYCKPLVALISTGNELQNPNDISLNAGKIRDSNKTTLENLMRKEGFETIDMGIAKDTPQDVLNKLYEALDVADILVCTGGVSMGEKDYLKRVLVTDLNAEIHFGSVLMKPGKPATFATCTFKGKHKLVFGLPGNPVSATVTSYLFVVPGCRKISGWEHPFYPKVKVQADKDFKLDPTRTEFHRVFLQWTTESGIPTAHSTGNQISSRLLSFSAADALLHLPQGTHDQTSIPAGSKLDALLISI